jgi:uncharacterized membrane protein YgaE (UPF0421/DUF939 family)
MEEHLMKKLLVMLLASIFSFGLVACQQRASEDNQQKVEEAVDKIKSKVQDSLGNKTEKERQEEMKKEKKEHTKATEEKK